VRAVNPTARAALLGAADTGAFLAQRRELLREQPRRAAGIAASLGLWLALAASASRDGERSRTPTLALAATVTAGNLALLGVHLRRGIAGPRVWLSAGLAAGALVSSLRRR
jgi:hypothetical protein